MEESFRLNQKNKKNRNDSAVQGTNDSAVLSKVSTAQCGYFQDDFLKYFVCKTVRRSPLINRGYYIRARVIDFVLKTFLNADSDNNKQIINLGAGFDSTFFRLKNLNLLDNVLFIEIDFPDVISRKINLIKSTKELSDLCPDLCKTDSVNENFIYKSAISKYTLIGLDLRDTRMFEAMLKSIETFSDAKPTLLLSEVVLTYMAINSCNSVIEWISETFQNCLLAIYEQINPESAFGQVMCTHFTKLGSPLKCILKYPTIESQLERHKQLGLSECRGIQVIDYFLNFIDDKENDRVDRLELFDEYEQWHLKCVHYALLASAKGDFCINLVKTMLDDKKESPRCKLERPLAQTYDVDITEFPLTFGIRFGHSICSNGEILCVIGGFGESLSELGRHRRLSSLEIVNLKTLEVNVFDKTPEANIGDRLFSSSCMRNKDSEILILFGRGSPDRMFDIIVVNYKIGENYRIENYEYKNGQLKPKERWRHASCQLENGEIILYGGKTFDSKTNHIETLNDFYVISNDHECRQITVDEDICKPRHSHSICQWKDFIVISGGLDEKELIRNEIILFDRNTFKMKLLTLNSGYITPRYSHTSHVIDDMLVLIGGVSFQSKQPGICLVDLNKLVAIEFDMPVKAPDGNPLMLQNHQTHVLDQTNILFIGGGGNCFSFGTHINKKPLVFNIRKCWEQFETNS